MASKDGLLMRKLAGQGKVLQVGSDTPVVIRIRHTDSSAAVTSVTVTTAVDIVLIDADATSTLDFATYSTVGLLADKINGLDNWECKVLDGLRSDATVSKFVNGAISSAVKEGVVVWDVLSDTSVLKQLAACATFDRSFKIDSKQKNGHQVRVKKATYLATLGAAAANAFKIVERDGSTETVLFQALSVSGASTSPIDYSSAEDMSLDSSKDLVVVLLDSASITDAAGNLLRVEYRAE